MKDRLPFNPGSHEGGRDPRSMQDVRDQVRDLGAPPREPISRSVAVKADGRGGSVRVVDDETISVHIAYPAEYGRRLLIAADMAGAILTYTGLDAEDRKLYHVTRK